jgi:hypothetical protein
MAICGLFVIFDMPIDDKALSAFQTRAVALVSEVLRRHSIDAKFNMKPGEPASCWTEFMIDGKPHLIAIFPHEINMREGVNLYECYLAREFKSTTTLAECFAKRLDSFLACGEWDSVVSPEAV